MRLQGVLSSNRNVYTNLERGRAHSGSEAAMHQGAQKFAEQGTQNTCAGAPRSMNPKSCIIIFAHIASTTLRKHTVQTPPRNATVF